MKCNCNDCMECPYDYCLDEERDNSDTARIRLQEYNNRYRNEHKDTINSRNRLRYQWKKTHGICVRCSNKAVRGIFCERHRT